MVAPDAKAPLGLKWRSNTFFILSTVAIGMFTDLFLYGLVVPILPFILVERIHIPHEDVQYWTSVLLACYAGAQVIFSVVTGIIADRLPSRKLPFLAGLTALFASTLLLYIGKTIEVLVIARLLQGMSASVVWTVGLALVMDTVGSSKLGVTIGSIFSIISVGELAAPVFGGIVYNKAGSGAVFGTVFGIMAIDVLMRLLIIEKKVAAKYVTESESEDEEASETSPLLSNGSTPEEELKQWVIPKDQPAWIRKLPILYCLGNRRLLVSQLVAFTQATLLAIFDSTIVLEAQDLFGFDSLKSGVLFIPLVLPNLVVGPLAGRAVDKYGGRIVATIGLAFTVIPLILLRIPHAGGAPEIAKLCVFLCMCSVGLAIISAPSIVEASYVVEQYHAANGDFFGEQGPYAQLYAVSSMVFSAGLTLGPLVGGTLRESIGYGNMNAVVAGWCAVVCFFTYLCLGKIPKPVEEEEYTGLNE